MHHDFLEKLKELVDHIICFFNLIIFYVLDIEGFYIYIYIYFMLDDVQDFFFFFCVFFFYHDSWFGSH